MRFLFSKFWILSLLSGYSVPLSAAEVELDGNLRLGLDYKQSRQTGEAYYRAQAKFETDRYQGVKAVLEAEADSSDRKNRMEDAYLNFKFYDIWRLYAGYKRVDFGWEYEQSSRKGFFPRRSEPYQRLEEYSYLNHEPLLAVKRKGKNSDFQIGLGLPSSKDYNL